MPLRLRRFRTVRRLDRRLRPLRSFIALAGFILGVTLIHGCKIASWSPPHGNRAATMYIADPVGKLLPRTAGRVSSWLPGIRTVLLVDGRFYLWDFNENAEHAVAVESGTKVPLVELGLSTATAFDSSIGTLLLSHHRPDLGLWTPAIRRRRFAIRSNYSGSSGGPAPGGPEWRDWSPGDPGVFGIPAETLQRIHDRFMADIGADQWMTPENIRRGHQLTWTIDPVWLGHDLAMLAVIGLLLRSARLRLSRHQRSMAGALGRRGRVAAGRCHRCRYAVAGISGTRCPECGAFLARHDHIGRRHE